MTKKNQTKIVLTRVQDIPLDKLVLAQTNVRRIQHGLSIDELAEDIARRGLLQNLCVRPELDGSGEPTGRFEVPAGGRRFRALQLLATQKRMARNAPVPCSVRTEGLAEEDSLAENVQRLALHPLDQYRAFAVLREKGLSNEDIAARFFVSINVVRQRMKLAAASPVLLDAYVGEELSLAQIEAFCVTDDHTRQEQVWASLRQAYNKEPHLIRRMLTDGAVRADDRRAVFVGVEHYEAAGGVVTRDLFQQDRGGYLQDSGLLDQLALARLDEAADAVRAEEWRWVTVAIDHPYGEAFGMRRIFGVVPELTEAQQAEETALQDERDRLEAEYQDAEDVPEAVNQRIDAIEAALEALDDRPAVFTDEERCRAGAFVSLSGEGRLRVERGYVRSEDDAVSAAGNESTSGSGAPDGDRAGPGGCDSRQAGELSEPGLKPLPERLLTELTAFRTLALREALAGDPETAQLALLHGLTQTLFYRGRGRSCLEVEARSATFYGVREIDDTQPARAMAERHQSWVRQLPEDAAALWGALQGFDADSRASLLAFCVAQTLNAAHGAGEGRKEAVAHADALAASLQFDPVAAGWRTTAQNYLAQVSKARILAAVREARGEAAASRLEALRKPDMAREAEALLAGTGWLPPELRSVAASPERADPDQPIALAA